MSDIAIKAENISKLYRLGNVNASTLRDDANALWARIRGKEDPTLALAQTNDRTQKGSTDYVWSLKEVNFEVKKGDVLGIVGRNGAGKSTLLKILSKVTAPTTGQIKVNGRIASLLEVGTGFHPELTGKENIYLNGHILGMRKKEIDRKFDEIVDFSGVERYIDTPVKRYSSGMYVRLAFGVAAHLESDILIIDEVLAVGDAEFQKKCLGKMQDVSKGEGRTVLFVSHNMGAVETICNKGIILKQGKLEFEGETKFIVSKYFNEAIESDEDYKLNIAKFRRDDCKNSNVLLRSVIVSGNFTSFPQFELGSKIEINFKFESLSKNDPIYIVLSIKNNKGAIVQMIYSHEENFFVDIDNKGEKVVTLKINQNILAPGRYFADVRLNPKLFTTSAFDCILDYPLFDIIPRRNNIFDTERGWGIANNAENEWKLV